MIRVPTPSRDALVNFSYTESSVAAWLVIDQLPPGNFGFLPVSTTGVG